MVLCELQDGKKKSLQSLFCSELSAVIYYIWFHSSVAICMSLNSKWRGRTNDPKNKCGRDPAAPGACLSLFYLNMYWGKNWLEIVLRCVSFVCNIFRLYKIIVGLPGNPWWKPKFGHDYCDTFTLPFGETESVIVEKHISNFIKVCHGQWLSVILVGRSSCRWSTEVQ